VKRVHVGKGAQTVLLGGYTILLLALTLLLQGGPGVRTNLAPFDEITRLGARLSRQGLFSAGLLYGLVGIVGNLGMFALWAFLLWKFLDGPGRAAWRLHIDVLLSGLLFSVGIETVQLFLPTRAADAADVLWNVLGTACGSALAHLGREVSLEWD
jgi:glycopeptide antibiotics resistance protein